MNVKQKKRVQEEIKFFIEANGYVPTSITDFERGTFHTYEREYAKKLLREIKKAKKNPNRNPSNIDFDSSRRFGITEYNLERIIAFIKKAYDFLEKGDIDAALNELERAKEIHKVVSSPDIGFLITAVKRRKDFPSDY